MGDAVPAPAFVLRTEPSSRPFGLQSVSHGVLNMDYSAEQMAEFFEFLDELRESGATNMFGAAAYLVDEFEMGRRDSSRVLSLWMKTFNDTPVEDRVAAALERDAA